MATMQDDVARLSHVAHGSTTGLTNVDLALRRRVVVLSYKDEAAGDAGFTTFGPLPFGITFNKVKLVPRAALTAHDTNYATIAIGSDDGAGGSFTALQTQTTKITGGTGNLTAGTAVSWSSIDSSDSLAAGVYVGAKVTKAARAWSRTSTSCSTSTGPSHGNSRKRRRAAAGLRHRQLYRDREP